MVKINYSIFYYRNNKNYFEYPLGIVFISDDGVFREFKHILDFSSFKDINPTVDVDMVKEILENIKNEVFNNKTFNLQLFTKGYCGDFYFDRVIKSNCDNYNEFVDFLSISILKIVGNTLIDDTLYENVSLQEMLNTLVKSIINNHSLPTYYWKNSDGEYMEIVEIDLNAGRFKTIDGDFSEYNWELENSNIFIKKK